MGSISFWQAEQATASPSALASAPLQGERTADAVVVGAGITGLSTALWLAREGARVVVVEGREVAAGASGRNAGFLLGGTAGTYASAIVRHGRERAKRGWAFSIENQILASQLVDELTHDGWHCGYHRTGSMRIARSESELQDVWESVHLLLEDGWEALQIDVDELPECLRGHYLGGSFHPTDGEIQPVHFVRGLAHLVQRAGAVIHEASPVLSLHEEADHVVARTPEGTIRAASAILATNAWLPDLLRSLGAASLAAAIAPQRGQMLATEPVHEELFTWPCYADEGYQYWRQLADGRLVVGGWRNHALETEATTDETPGAPVQDLLERFLRQTLALPPSQVGITHRWAGIMAFSADGLPLVGRVPTTERTYVAGAYTGHGNAYAIAAARVVTDLICSGAHPEADLFDPARLGAPVGPAARA